MLDAGTVWTALASSAVVSGAVQMVAKYYFDARIERDKAQLLDAVNAKVETLKAQLQQQTDRLAAEQARVTDRLHTVFSTLQTERAQAVKELYAKIVNVESLLNYLSIERTISDESAALFRDAVHEFLSFYLPNRIWLPSAVSDQVNELRSTFFSMQKAIAAAPRDVPISADFRRGLTVAKGATAHTLEDVLASFRDLLGAETS